MAKNTSCDICGQPAVSSAEFKTDTTTPLKWDLCADHQAEIKKIIRAFTKQDLAEVKIEGDVISVVAEERVLDDQS